VMAFDLIVRNATLPDNRSGLDIACANGKIVAIEPNISAEAGRTIDARRAARLAAFYRRGISTWTQRCRSGCRG